MVDYVRIVKNNLIILLVVCLMHGTHSGKTNQQLETEVGKLQKRCTVLENMIAQSKADWNARISGLQKTLQADILSESSNRRSKDDEVSRRVGAVENTVYAQIQRLETMLKREHDRIEETKRTSKTQPDTLNRKIAELHPSFEKSHQSESEKRKANDLHLSALIETLNETVTAMSDTQDGVEAWFRMTYKQVHRYYSALLYAGWNSATNITNHNIRLYKKSEIELYTFLKKIGKDCEKRFRADWDDDTKRKLKLCQKYNFSPKNRSHQSRLVYVKSKMARIYSTAKACRPNGKCLSLSPELLTIISRTKNTEQMKWVWLAWRDVTGRPSRKLYTEYIKLSNIAARDSGYSDAGSYWRISNFGTEKIDKVADMLIEQLQPMYKQLFTYVRRKLIERYGNQSGIEEGGPIPAHLLGNMWAQRWVSLTYKGIVLPFPGVSSGDVTKELFKRNYTVTDLLKMAEEFFTSIGLFPMTEEFWNNSMFVKPEGRKVSCHPTAYDFWDETDFRIKICGAVTRRWLQIIHHEMGHIQYYMAYRNQPVIYRDSPNSAFHEAIGDMIGLSVDTVPHLKAIGLINDSNVTAEQRDKEDINFLMWQALTSIAFLPYGYIVDKVRWGMFDGSIPADAYNRKWWEMRLKYQGLVPPVKRSERDFDLGSKYHVLYDIPYLRYFISTILQFQFYKAMCKEAKHVGPLHTCDFYRSKAAGRKLKNMLQMGNSRPWQDAMEAMTGQRDISAAAIIEYFKPLIDWLKTQNRNEKTIGWMNCEKSVESIIDKYFE